MLLTTGGTIAARAASPDASIHYRLDPDGPALDPDLLAALHGVASLAHEAVVKLPSSDLGAEHLLHLARRILHHQSDPAVDGIVITHGTDTLEETALFLALTVPPGKPVVLTAAMRPGGALGGDGPRNLMGAARVAGDPAAAERGVLVVMDDQVIGGASARKRHTSALGAFRPEAEGLVGELLPDRVAFTGEVVTALPRFCIAGLTELPRVEILYCHQDLPEHLFDAVIAAGTQGLVLACTGNGTLSEVARRGAERAIREGVVVVRSSRTGAGRVTWTDAPGIASGPLNPQQARILLMLSLADGQQVSAIAAAFSRL
jgi:L-asparaginase